ncbi:hypothetical protein NE865_00536 [Phthorimaea operculella]|nr:hypothetical protein NE865_00536 [Phthorimaea operculella]
MGRKIPAKKHRGVKDPLVQQAKRLESLKGKIDAPPRDPDEQPVPKSLLRLFGAPAVERRERKPRGAPTGPAARGGRGGKQGGAGNPVAKLQRLPGESVRSFSKRITGATRALHSADDPHYYPSQVDEEEEYERPARRWRGAGEDKPRETKAQRRKQKIMLKKQEIEKALKDQAPPPIVPRPGRRQLLLSGMLAGAGQGGTKPTSGVKAVPHIRAGVRRRCSALVKAARVPAREHRQRLLNVLTIQLDITIDKLVVAHN